MSVIPFPKHKVRGPKVYDPLDYPNEGEIYLLPAPIERRPPNMLELWHLSILFWAAFFLAWGR